MTKPRRIHTRFDTEATKQAARAVARGNRQLALIDGLEPWFTRQNRAAQVEGIDLVNRLTFAGFKIACATSPAGQDTHFEYTISAGA